MLKADEYRALSHTVSIAGQLVTGTHVKAGAAVKDQLNGRGNINKTGFYICTLLRKELAVQIEICLFVVFILKWKQQIPHG